MLDAIRGFFNTFSAAPRLSMGRGDDPRIAAAALLFHLMDADGVRDEAESAALRTLLRDEFDLDADALDELLSAGEEAEAEAVDLHAFTSILMRHWDETARAAFVGMLWEVAFADNMLHEVEDHTLWRVADLLGVDGRDRVLMRQAAARRKATDQG